MVRTGLWVELQAIVWFIVGLGLASLMGERTLPLVLMIVFEMVVSPILLLVGIPHMINLQRSVVDLAVDHMEPSALGFALPGIAGGGPGETFNASSLTPESRIVAVMVIVAWLVGWTILGAWRMMTRDV